MLRTTSKEIASLFCFRAPTDDHPRAWHDQQFPIWCRLAMAKLSSDVCQGGGSMASLNARAAQVRFVLVDVAEEQRQWHLQQSDVRVRKPHHSLLMSGFVSVHPRKHVSLDGCNHCFSMHASGSCDISTAGPSRSPDGDVVLLREECTILECVLAGLGRFRSHVLVICVPSLKPKADCFHGCTRCWCATVGKTVARLLEAQATVNASGSGNGSPPHLRCA